MGRVGHLVRGGDGEGRWTEGGGGPGQRTQAQSGQGTSRACIVVWPAGREGNVQGGLWLSGSPGKFNRRVRVRWGAMGRDAGGLTGVLIRKVGAWGRGQNSWGSWLAAVPREASGPGGEEEELGLARLGLTHPEGSWGVEVGV